MTVMAASFNTGNLMIVSLGRTSAETELTENVTSSYGCLHAGWVFEWQQRV